jgi:hypothetical protein
MTMNKTIRRYGWLAFAGLVAVTLLLPVKARVQESPQGTVLLPPPPDQQKNLNPKLDFALQRLTDIYAAEGIEKVREYAAQHKIDMKGDYIRVIAEADYGSLGSAGLQARVSIISGEIEALGGRVETSYEHLIQHLAPPWAIQAIAQLPTVRLLRLPLKPFPMVLTSEGVAKTGAGTWQAVTPYRTTEKVKVCIFDLGFKGYASLLGTELPSSVTVRSFRADNDIEGGEVHGAACAEIVHDMAPEADLFLVNFSTEVEHHQAVDWIIDQGVKVISYSVGWWNSGDGKGTGPICDDVEKAYDAGIIWCNSAGNAAEDHWEGVFSDPDANNRMNFSGSDELLMTSGYSCYAWMNWDDWGTWNGTSYSGSDNDYNLYLYYWSGGLWNLIDSSTGSQNGNDEPTEFVGASSSVPLYWALLIYKHSATRNCKLEIFTSGNSAPIEYNVPAGSILIPADSPYAVTVGATDCITDALHSYSSRGPTQDGRIKPDFTAPSGVTTQTYGDRNFYGTSASAPHMAGAFGLIIGKAPFSVSQIKAILEGRALDLGASGKDNLYGIGRLKLTK